MKKFLYPLLILFSILFIFLLKHAYYLNSSAPSTIISKHQWADWLPIKNKKLLTGQKIQTEFQASDNRLGAVEINLNVYGQIVDREHINYDSLIFRIKPKGDQEWYYQNQYSNITHSKDWFDKWEYLNPDHSTVFFPFGFPLIENSKGKIYQIEIESVSGTDNQSFSLNPRTSYLLSKYSFSLSYLKQHKNQIPFFILAKARSLITALTTVSLINYIYMVLASLLISLLPIKKTPKKLKYFEQLFINFSSNLWLLVIGLFIFQLVFSVSERLEWLLYLASTASIILLSLFLSIRLKTKSSLLPHTTLIRLYAIILASFTFMLLLTQKITLQHLLFLFLAFLPSLLPQSILINLIAILATLTYFNLTFPYYSVLYLSLIFIITVVLYLILRSIRKIPDFKISTSVITVLLLPVIIYLTQKPIDYHHYMNYVGPAFEVLKGKSILGGIPSIYGYLSIHFIVSVLKFIGLTMTSFHFFNIALYILYYLIAVFIFFKLIKNKLVALIAGLVFITLQTVFSYHSISFPPQVGPMRFGFGLLIVYLIIHLTQSKSFIFGTFLSAISVFWSAETSFYIVPAWLMTMLIFSYQSSQSLQQFIKASIKKFSIFIFTTITILGLIILKEHWLHHRWPRLLSYFEAAQSSQDWSVALTIPGFGNFYLIIPVLILGIVTTIHLLVNQSKIKSLPLVGFITIHNLSLFSYFVSRSHENNVVNITGFALLELVIITNALIKAHKIKAHQLIRVFSLPIILFLTLYSFRVTEQIFKLNQYIQTSFQQNLNNLIHFSPSVPVLKTALIKNQLLNQPVALLSFEYDTQLLIESDIENQLPLNPAQMHTWIPADHHQEYINPPLNNLSIGTVVFVHQAVNQSLLGPVWDKLQNIYQLRYIDNIPQANLLIYQITATKAASRAI